MSIIALWLPVVVAAVAVFVASSLIHMVFKWHASDYRPLANEDEVQAVLRAGNPTPGQYVLPHCADMAAMQSEPMLSKYRAGPVGFIQVLPSGDPDMRGSLVKWFVFNLVVAALAALIAAHVLGHGVSAVEAGHLAAILSFLTYGGGSIQSGIWMGKRWGSVAKDQLDALIYAAVTGFVFIWLWPTVG